MAKKFIVRRVVAKGDGTLVEADTAAGPTDPIDAAAVGPPDGAAITAGPTTGPAPACDALTLALTPSQRLAMERLAAGETVVDAARAAGVTRMTLHRWLKQDPRFVAAYNAWQQETLDSARGRLMALADVAVTTVGNAMRNGDTRAALAVLKAMGTLEQPTAGQTDPKMVQREMNAKAARAERQMFTQEFEM